MTDGPLDVFADNPEELEQVKEEVPIFRPPTAETPNRVAQLEHLVGPVPLSLKGWYEEVGSVNFIGLFPSSPTRVFHHRDGYVLDPLFIYSVEMAIKMVTVYLEDGAWYRDPILALAPDDAFKYGFGGTGPYSVQLPQKTFDAPLLLERHETTFVNYLRIFFRWGGFPGLDRKMLLTSDEVDFLTKGLLPF